MKNKKEIWKILTLFHYLLSEILEAYICYMNESAKI